MPSTATILAATFLAAAAVGTAAAHPAAADPRKCFVVTGPDGQPLNTTCVPWPFPETG
jgi:ABC-type sugar transport system substrate-binding protein